MIEKTFLMEQNPFHKIDEFQKAKAKDRVSVRTDISPEDYQLIENYFKQRPDDIDNSKFVRELLIDFFNDHVFERKYFRNLHAIMLLPKSFNPDELNEKSVLIGFVDFKDNFTNPAMFIGGARYKLTHKLFYTLEEFNKKNYEQLNLDSLDKSVLFNVSKDIQDDFDKVRARLKVLYEDIDIDDAYFVMFKLNNYLDVEDKGTFHSEVSSWSHEGALVLLEDFENNVCACFLWSYFENEFSFELKFHHISYFNNRLTIELKQNGFDYEDLLISETYSREESLRRKIKSYESTIKHYQRMKIKAEKRLEKELEREY